MCNPVLLNTASRYSFFKRYTPNFYFLPLRLFTLLLISDFFIKIFIGKEGTALRRFFKSYIRITVCIIAVAIFCFIPISADFPSPQSTGVYASYSGDDNFWLISPEGSTYYIETGSAFITVTVPETNPSYRLAVREIRISEKEAYDWLIGKLPKDAASIVAYEFYFIDKDGNKVSDVNASASIELKASLVPNGIFTVNSDNVSETLFQTGDSGQIVLSLNDIGYHVLSFDGTPYESDNKNETDNGGESETSTNISDVIVLIISIIAGAGVGAVFALIFGRKSQKRAEKTPN